MDVIREPHGIGMASNHDTVQVPPFVYLMLLYGVSSCLIIKCFRLFHKSQLLCFHGTPHKTELPPKQQNKGNGSENVKRREENPRLEILLLTHLKHFY